MKKQLQLKDNSESPAKGTKRRKVNFSRFTILQLMDLIVENIEDSALDDEYLDIVVKEREELSKRLGLTDMQAIFMALLANMADDYEIHIRQIASFLGCKPIMVQAYWGSIEALAQKRLIYITTKGTDKVRISVSSKAMNSFRKNMAYVAPDYKNLNVDEWVSSLSNLMDEREEELIDYDLLSHEIELLMKGNMHLQVVSEIVKHNLEKDSQMILLRTIEKLIVDNDEEISTRDITEILTNSIEARQHTRKIISGKHELVKKGLIELLNEDGYSNPNAWHLTEKAKQTLLAELQISETKTEHDLLQSAKLQEKQLFYNSEITDMVNQLRDILSQEQFVRIQKQLAEHGMRQGMTCIFYGAPGTGKTETVYQLARATGRDIFPVDIPSMRSKWVGETEKNIKAVFDRYRALVKRCEVAPILLFNEADAVLGKRNENTVHSVDKMENAMQNIILQEMENFEGIMIATTNLTSNLDAAFDRRFLYKIEFPKPTPEESRHIWKAMLHDISDEDARMLAQQYAFSGGQIENIARKQVVNSILFPLNEEQKMKQIIQACNTEQLNRSTIRKPIGFNG